MPLLTLFGSCLNWHIKVIFIKIKQTGKSGSYLKRNIWTCGLAEASGKASGCSIHRNGLGREENWFWPDEKRQAWGYNDARRIYWKQKANNPAQTIAIGSYRNGAPNGRSIIRWLSGFLLRLERYGEYLKENGMMEKPSLEVHGIFNRRSWVTTASMAWLGHLAEDWLQESQMV